MNEGDIYILKTNMIVLDESCEAGGRFRIFNYVENFMIELKSIENPKIKVCIHASKTEPPSMYRSEVFCINSDSPEWTILDYFVDNNTWQRKLLIDDILEDDV